MDTGLWLRKAFVHAGASVNKYLQNINSLYFIAMTIPPSRPAKRLTQKYAPEKIDAAYGVAGIERGALIGRVVQKLEGLRLPRSVLNPISKFEQHVDSTVANVAGRHGAFVALTEGTCSLNSLRDAGVLSTPLSGAVYSFNARKERSLASESNRQGWILCAQDLPRWSNADFIDFHGLPDIGARAMREVLTLAELGRTIRSRPAPPAPAAGNMEELLQQLDVLARDNGQRQEELRDLLKRWTGEPKPGEAKP